MRIGVVGDTHNHLPNVGRIVELFETAGVERVIHTGDITQPKTLDVFSRLRRPIHGVFGNNDEVERLAATAAELAMAIVTPPLELAWAGRRIRVVHDPLELEGLPDPDGPPDLVLHGHTHRHRHERVDGSLVFNPGECAGHMKGLNAVGVVDLTVLECEILNF